MFAASNPVVYEEPTENNFSLSELNIATAMFRLSCGEPIEDAIYDAFNIAMSVVVIGTTIWEPTYLTSILLGAFGIAKDTYDIITALINRDWCGVVSGIGYMTIDLISMGTQINDHNWGLLLEESNLFEMESREP